MQNPHCANLPPNDRTMQIFTMHYASASNFEKTTLIRIRTMQNRTMQGLTVGVLNNNADFHSIINLLRHIFH